MYPTPGTQTCFDAKNVPISTNRAEKAHHFLCCISSLWCSQPNSSIVSDGPCFSPLFFPSLFGLVVSYWDFWGWKQPQLRHTHTETHIDKKHPLPQWSTRPFTQPLGVLETPIWASGASHTWLTPLSHINTLSTRPDMLCQWKVPPHQIFSGSYWCGGTRGRQ